MKTILIATDFSGASRNAALYALALAKEIDANIYLVNSYKVSQPAAGLQLGVSRYDVMMQTDKRLLDEASQLDPENKRMEIVCDEGEPAPTILKLAMEKSADFIVIGMKGSGKNIKKIFGSTATTLAQTCNIPVIIVPEKAGYTTPKKLVYATDAVVPGSTIPVELKEVTTLFDSRLFVVKVVNDNSECQSDTNTAIPHDESGNSQVTFKYVVDTDINRALDKFTRRHAADMLVMMPHKHDWLEKLFKKSETKEMIFHTNIPILILPEAHGNIHQTLQKESNGLTIKS
ncbi:MAG: universal stress protein [Ginsengibacter sp.]